MFRQFREIKEGEFIIIVADTSQGGRDENFCHFISKTNLDIPLVYQHKGVAAQMTADLFPVIERIYDLTGVKPLVCIERNNGGASEMERLRVLNRGNKYDLYVMPVIGATEDATTKKLGFDTNSSTRPDIVGGLLDCINSVALIVYDEETISQLKSFIVNRNGKPEAANGKRDDAVMALAIGFKLYQTATPAASTQYNYRVAEENQYKQEKWRIS